MFHVAIFFFALSLVFVVHNIFVLSPTRLGWHGNSGPLGDRPEQRLNKAPFDELKNIPLPGYVAVFFYFADVEFI
jgi:hypothetical protein